MSFKWLESMDLRWQKLAISATADCFSIPSVCLLPCCGKHMTPITSNHLCIFLLLILPSSQDFITKHTVTSILLTLSISISVIYIYNLTKSERMFTATFKMIKKFWKKCRFLHKTISVVIGSKYLVNFMSVLY